MYVQYYVQAGVFTEGKKLSFPWDWTVGVASISTIFFKNSSGNLSVLFLTKTHADRKKVRQKDNSYPRGLQSHCCLHTANPTGRPEKECHMCPEIQNRERSSIRVKIVTWQVMRFSSGELLSDQFHVCKQLQCSKQTTQTWVHQVILLKP